MKTVQFTHFINQNVAPKSAKKIAVQSPAGKHICDIDLGHLAFPDAERKLYSFGALSDIHVSENVATSEDDFRVALAYYIDTEKVDFVCIAGDLTQYATDVEWDLYKKCVAEESDEIPIYPIAGNHDCYGTGMTDARFEKYTGYKTFYTFEQENDVFIMLSQLAWASQSSNVQPFVTTQMQALYEVLESNRNKRCFVFMHPFPWGKAGDPFELYSSNSFWGTQGTAIYNLMSHYKNTLWFHGHSHQMFETQIYSKMATYDNTFGCHNIHIPSCAKPVMATPDGRTDMIAGSQGYVVDVYEDGIHLRGRDFVNGEFLPIASYWLDTTIKEIEANTFVDETGVIVT